MGRNIESDKSSIRRSRQPRGNPRIRRRSAVGTLLACIGVTWAHEQKSARTSLVQFRTTVSKWLDDACFPSSVAGLYTLRFAIEGAPNEEVMHALRVATTPGQMVFATDAGRTVVLPRNNPVGLAVFQFCFLRPFMGWVPSSSCCSKLEMSWLCSVVTGSGNCVGENYWFRSDALPLFGCDVIIWLRFLPMN